MKRYELPMLDEKHEVKESYSEDAPITAEGPDSWERRVHIPVNPEIIEALKVGGQASITLYGSVVELSSTDSDEGRARNNITLLITAVEVSDEAESKDDAFVSGFDGTNKSYRNNY